MEVRVQPCIFPDVWASPNVKHEVSIIMNIYVDERRGRVFTPIPEGWEGSYTCKKVLDPTFLGGIITEIMATLDEGSRSRDQ